MTTPLSPEELAKLKLNFEAARRAVDLVGAGKPHEERCAFCRELIVVEHFPKQPPYTTFNTSCPCGKCVGQFKFFGP